MTKREQTPVDSAMVKCRSNFRFGEGNVGSAPSKKPIDLAIALKKVVSVFISKKVPEIVPWRETNWSYSHYVEQGAGYSVTVQTMGM